MASAFFSDTMITPVWMLYLSAVRLDAATLVGIAADMGMVCKIAASHLVILIPVQAVRMDFFVTLTRVIFPRTAGKCQYIFC